MQLFKTFNDQADATAAIYDDDASRAALDQVNQNYSTKNISDTLLAVNGLKLAEEEDKRLKTEAENLVVSGNAQYFPGSGTYVDKNGRKIYKDNMFREKFQAEQTDYENARKFGFDRDQHKIANDAIATTERLKNIESQQAILRSNGLSNQADVLENERQSLIGENSRRFAQLGAKANLIGAFRDSKKTAFQKMAEHSGIDKAFNWAVSKGWSDKNIANSMNVQGQDTVSRVNPAELSTEKRGILENIGDVFTDKGNVPFLGIVAKTAESMNQVQAAKRLELGIDFYRSALAQKMPGAPNAQIEAMAQNAYLNDKNLLVERSNENQEKELRGDTFGGKVASITGQSLPYMAEFVGTGVAGAGVKGMLSGGAKQAGKGLLKYSGGWKNLGRAAGDFAKDVGYQTGIRSPYILAKGVPTGAEKYADAAIREDDRGDFALDRNVNQGAEFGAGTVDAFAEVASESTGNLLRLALPVRSSRRVVQAYARAMNRLPGQRLMKYLNKARGWNGTFGEVLEERIGDIIKGTAGINSNGSLMERIDKEFPTSEEMMQELVSFGITPVILRGAGLTASKIANWRRGAVKELSKTARDIGLELEQQRIAALEAGEERWDSEFDNFDDMDKLDMSGGDISESGTTAVASHGAVAQVMDHSLKNYVPEEREIKRTAKRYRKEFGNVLSTDNVKLMFRDEGYDPHSEQSVVEFHKKAGPITGELFDLFLKSRKGKGNGTVIFTGGGNGSGKSSVLSADAASNADFVMDSTMVNLDAVRNSIQKVIDNGQIPVLTFAYRAPADAWFNGVLRRNESKDGHIVPKKTFANTHSKAKENFISLVEEFGGKVYYSIKENRYREEPRDITLDELKGKPTYTKDQILEVINGNEITAEQRTDGQDNEGIQRSNDTTGISNSIGRDQGRLVEGEDEIGRIDGVADKTSEELSGENTVGQAEVEQESVSAQNVSFAENAQKVPKEEEEIKRKISEKYPDASVKFVDKPDKTQSAVAEFFKKNLGREVVFYSGSLKADGFSYGDKLYVNGDNTKPLMATAFHEYTHDLKKKDKVAYQELFDEIKRIAPKDKLDEWKSKYNKKYSDQNYPILEDSELEDEFIADVTGEIGGSGKLLKEIGKMHPNILQKFLNWLKRLKNAIYKDADLGDDVRRVLEGQFERAEKIVYKTIGNKIIQDGQVEKAKENDIITEEKGKEAADEQGRDSEYDNELTVHSPVSSEPNRVVQDRPSGSTQERGVDEGTSEGGRKLQSSSGDVREERSRERGSDHDAAERTDSRVEFGAVELEPGREEASKEVVDGNLRDERSGGLSLLSERGGVEDVPRGRRAAGVDAGRTESRDTSEGSGDESEEKLSNHRILDSDVLIVGGDSSKINANIRAIKLLKTLEKENQEANSDEQNVLAQYVGWGGLPSVFNFDNKNYSVLKELLTNEEYSAARASTINAHYTDRLVIKSIWDIAKRLGFKGGKAGEFGAGIGHFLGLIPDDLYSKTKFRAVELDSISGRILSKLYPNADVSIKGLQDVKIQNNSLDIVIGNFPFAKDGPYDKNYPKFSLHNYFFARAIDAIKPGGVIISVTSSSTLDSDASLRAREYFSGKADLVGAIRLPEDSFKKNAGTSVVTDIVILRKKDGSPFSGESFQNSVTTDTSDNTGTVKINEYYAKHPEMLLGKLSNSGGMYRGNEQTLLSNGELAEQLPNAINNLPENVFGVAQRVVDSVDLSGDEVGKFKDFEIFEKNGELFQMNGDKAEKMKNGKRPLSVRDREKVKSYLRLKDAFNKIINDMLDNEVGDSVLSRDQKKLEKLYDEHVKKYGNISDARKNKILSEDPNYLRISGLENSKRSGKVVTYIKSDIFTKRTIFRTKIPNHAETVSDAANISINTYGSLNLSYIASLIGKDEESAKKELLSGDRFFEDPATGMIEPAGKYLSGNVAEKLRIAKEEGIERNVSALEKVQPVRKEIGSIGFQLGSSWIPAEVVEKWGFDTFHQKIKVSYNDHTDRWKATCQNRYGISKFSSSSFDAIDILEHALNLQNFVVRRKVNDSYMIDQEATLMARQYREEMINSFSEFVNKDSDSAKNVEDAFNTKINVYVPRFYDLPENKFYPNASHIVDGKEFTLLEHQKRLVSRCMEGNTLIAHCVGAGKTYAMITAAMELVRTGLAHKNLIVVQNATLDQFAESVMKLYPNSKTLIASKDDLAGDKRKRFMSRIATGHWDIVVMAQSSFNMIEDRPEFERNQNLKMIADYEQIISDLEKEDPYGNRITVKDVERQKKRLEERNKKLSDRKKDNNLYFDELGFDSLFVDEAHEYKKNTFVTKLPNIKGLDKGNSQKAYSLSLKIMQMMQKNGGRNIFFASGTPVTNTLTEIWNMVRYLSPKSLSDFHVETFDRFASMFTKTVQGMEIDAAGRFRIVERFAEYNNIEELSKFFSSVADIVHSEDLKGVKRPPIKGGAPQAMVIKRSELIGKFMNYLGDYYSWYENLSGKEKKENSYIPLQIYGLAKKASIDFRLIDSSLPDDHDSKLNQASRKIVEKYHEYESVKGAQVVFFDLYQSPDGKFNAYQELKKKLVENGIPEKEVAVITDYDTDTKRGNLFSEVNNGSVRVVIGSTMRLGVGVNMQERLACAHHLDAPSRPSDMEQRNGRIIRQGNTIPEVEIFNYAIEQTLDAGSYQMLARKDKFIKSVMRGKGGNHQESEEDTDSLDYASFSAMISGNPKAMRKVEVDGQVKKLNALKDQNYKTIRQLQNDNFTLEREIEAYGREIEKVENFIKRFGDTSFKDEIKIEYKGTKKKVDRKTGMDLLDKLISSVQKEDNGYSVDLSVNDIPLRMSVRSDDLFRRVGYTLIEEFSASAVRQGSGEITKGIGFLNSLTSLIASKPEELDAIKNKIQEHRNRIENNKTEIQKGFPYQAELEKNLAEQADLIKDLKIGGKEEERISKRPSLSDYISGASLKSEEEVLLGEEGEDTGVSLSIRGLDTTSDDIAPQNGKKVKNEFPRNQMENGDTEVENVFVETKMHMKTSFAQKLLKDKIAEHKKKTGKNYLESENEKIGMIARINTASSDKMRSGKAVKQSSVKPYVHAAAIANIEKLFQKSTLGVSHDGHKEDDEKSILQVHRFYCGMEYEGKQYGVKLTVKELKEGYNLLYSMEAHDIEVFEIKNPETGKPFGDMARSQTRKEHDEPWAAFQQILHFKDFFDKFKPLNDLHKDIIPQNSEKVKSESDGSDGIKLSIKSALDKSWLESFKEASHLKDKSERPDITKLGKLFGTLPFYGEKVPALKRMITDSLCFEQDTNLLEKSLYGDDLETLSSFRKSEEYRKLADYILERDKNASGYTVRKEKDTFGIFNPQGIRVEGVLNENTAWNRAFELEANDLKMAGFSDFSANALMAFRKVNARNYEMLLGNAEDLKKTYAGIHESIPLIDGVDIFEELKKMGDRRGHYMPRIRHGRYMLYANKTGENPRLEMFDTRVARMVRATALVRQGWHVKKDITDTPSEEAFNGASIAKINDIIQRGLENVAEGSRVKFSDFGLSSGFTEYNKKDGTTERHFIIRGDKGKLFSEIFKDCGGHFYDNAWHFENADEEIEKMILGLIGRQTAHNGILNSVGQEIAKQIAVLIHARGSRQRKTSRDGRTGKNVYLGYEEDAFKALRLSTSATAAGTAKNVLARRLADDMAGTDVSFDEYASLHENSGFKKGSKDWINDRRRLHMEYEEEVDRKRIDSSKQPEAYKEAISLNQEMLRNTESSERVIGKIRALAAFKYLSRISTGLINMTSLFTSAPSMMHAHGGIEIKKALKELPSAAKKYVRFVSYSKYGKKNGKIAPLSEEEMNVFSKIEERGWISSQVNKEALGLGLTFAGEKVRLWASRLLIAQEITERINRASLIYASYKSLCDLHKGALSESQKDEYLEKAKFISDRANGIYGKPGLPSWARGSDLPAQFARSWYMFKTYPHTYVQSLLEAGFKKKDIVAVSWMMFSPVALSGVAASPILAFGASYFVPFVIKAIYSILGQEPPDDPDEAIYDYLNEKFGKYGGRAYRHGLSGVLGINISGSLSMNDFKLPTTLKELGGAPASFVMDELEGMNSIRKGNIWKGTEKMLPALAAAPVRAVREAVQGVTDSRGNPVYWGRERLAGDWADTLIRSVGFNPVDISEKTEKKWNEKQIQKNYSELRGLIYDRVRRYYLNGGEDPVEALKIQKEIESYNARVRRNRPNGVSIITSRQLKSIKTRMFRVERIERV